MVMIRICLESACSRETGGQGERTFYSCGKTVPVELTISPWAGDTWVACVYGKGFPSRKSAGDR